MAFTSLIENFRTLDVTDDTGQCLPFKPGRGFESAREKLGQVDRYLFRLFDEQSDGSMNDIWVKSKDAHRDIPASKTDVFARSDHKAAAQALRRHLQWQGQLDTEDNFVSWTSSLLLVLQYANYRARRLNVDFAKMDLCVVDTTLLPAGSFLNDMALIQAFSQYDDPTDPGSLQSLQSLQNLRQGDKYYFGEYLSQGALRIEGCCSIVSMRHIVDDGLWYLRRELVEAESYNGQWAKRVVGLREMFYESKMFYGSENVWLAVEKEVTAAMNIGKKYGTSWQIPIALAFLALKPRRRSDDEIIKEFRKLYDRDHGASELSPERTAVVLHHALPEVQQFDRLRRYVYEDFLLHTVIQVQQSQARPTARAPAFEASTNDA